jgi:hypothetical protein
MGILRNPLMVLLVSGMVWAASPAGSAPPLFFAPNSGQAPLHGHG